MGSVARQLQRMASMDVVQGIPGILMITCALSRQSSSSCMHNEVRGGLLLVRSQGSQRTRGHGIDREHDGKKHCCCACSLL